MAGKWCGADSLRLVLILVFVASVTPASVTPAVVTPASVTPASVTPAVGNASGGGKGTALPLSRVTGEVDSTDFRKLYHYSIGYNFRLLADSFPLAASPQEACEAVWVYSDDDLVVADVRMQQSSTAAGDTLQTLWVKVAHTQEVQGWLSLDDFARIAVPAHPLAKIIHLYFHRRVLLGAGLLLIALYVLLGSFVSRARSPREKLPRLFHNPANTIYQSLARISLVAVALMVGRIMKERSEEWTEYYFHPTLSPLGQDGQMGIVLWSLWITAVVAVASVDDLCARLRCGGVVRALIFNAAVAALVAWGLTSLLFGGSSVACAAVAVVYIVADLLSAFHWHRRMRRPTNPLKP